MSLFTLMLRMSENTDGKILVEDHHMNRIGTIVWNESDHKWYMLTLADDAPKFLKDYEVTGIQLMAGDLFITVSW